MRTRCPGREEREGERRYFGGIWIFSGVASSVELNLVLLGVHKNFSIFLAIYMLKRFKYRHCQIPPWPLLAEMVGR